MASGAHSHNLSNQALRGVQVIPATQANTVCSGILSPDSVWSIKRAVLCRVLDTS
jgi:hypothetical protein